MADTLDHPSGTVRAELRTLTRLALPIALAQACFVSMTLVDTAIVGRTSVDDLAATSMGRSIVYTTGSFGLGLSLALDPLAAQAVGAGRAGRAWAALLATLRAIVLTSAVAAAISFTLTLALRPLGIDAALIPRVRLYMLGYLPGIFLFPAFLATKSFLQAHGETRPVLIATIAANLVNLVVCNLLVRGDDALRWARLPGIGLPRLGALGAGLAASVGTLVLLGIVLLAAARRRHPASTEGAVPLGAVYRLGIPIGLQLLAEISVFSLAAVLAGRFGAHAVSAHQIAIGLASCTFMVAVGVGGATAVRVGHAVGAGVSPRRAGLLGLLLASGVMGIGATAFATIPHLLIGAFTSDPTVAAMGVPLLGLAAVFQLFDGVQVVAAAALRGAGDVRFPFLANVGAHWMLGLPLSLALGFGLELGVRGLWIGLTAGLIAIAILLTTRFLRLTQRPVERLEV